MSSLAHVCFLCGCSLACTPTWPLSPGCMGQPHSQLQAKVPHLSIASLSSMSVGRSHTGTALEQSGIISHSEQVSQQTAMNDGTGNRTHTSLFNATHTLFTGCKMEEWAHILASGLMTSLKITLSSKLHNIKMRHRQPALAEMLHADEVGLTFLIIFLLGASAHSTGMCSRNASTVAGCRPSPSLQTAHEAVLPAPSPLFVATSSFLAKLVPCSPRAQSQETLVEPHGTWLHL